MGYILIATKRTEREEMSLTLQYSHKINLANERKEKQRNICLIKGVINILCHALRGGVGGIWRSVTEYNEK